MENLLGGYMKFKKTCKQLAAYDIAIEQTLGMKVQQAAVLYQLQSVLRYLKYQDSLIL